MTFALFSLFLQVRERRAGYNNRGIIARSSIASYGKLFYYKVTQKELQIIQGFNFTLFIGLFLAIRGGRPLFGRGDGQLQLDGGSH